MVFNWYNLIIINSCKIFNLHSLSRWIYPYFLSSVKFKRKWHSTMSNSSANRWSLSVNSWPFRWHNRRRRIRPVGIVTLELTSFARSGFAVNETLRAEGCAQRGTAQNRKEKQRTDKNKLVLLSASLAQYLDRRRARSVRQILWFFCTHIRVHLNARTCPV